MAIQTFDFPEYTLTVETRAAGDGTPNAATTRTLTYKPGTSGDNQQTIQQQAISAIATLESNYTNWPSMTAAQKDTANRLAQRVTAKTIRYLLGQLDSAGP